MYYEIEGTGEPLVYIPPAFGYAGVNAFPTLRRNRQVITMDLQGHGRTADIPERPITFDQHAKDVIGLLDYLGIDRADLFGESFGGVIATLIAVRHPTMVNRLITYGATFGKPQDSLRPELFRTHLILNTGRLSGKRFSVCKILVSQKKNSHPFRLPF